MEATFQIFIVTFKHTVIFTFISLINLLKIRLRHARKRSITVICTRLLCHASLACLKKARCYKSYTQQVRLKSWRNPKGGILSTEVVFFNFLIFFFFSLRWVWKPLQLKHNEVTGRRVCEGVYLNTIPCDGFLFYSWEEVEFETNTTWMLFRGGS